MADRDVERLPDSDYFRDCYTGPAPKSTFAQSVNTPAPNSYTTTLPNHFPEPEASFGHYVLALLGKAAKRKPRTQKKKHWLNQPFETRVAAFGISNLFYYQESKSEVRVNLATLQKISLHQQQKDLVGLAGKVIRARSVKGLEKTLRTSLQDYGTS